MASQVAAPPASTPSTARRSLAVGGVLGRIENITGITFGGLLILVLAVAGWGLARFAGNKGLYLLVYCGVLLLVASIVISRRKRAIEASRSQFARRAREGQVIEVEISLASKRRLGMFTIEEKLPPALGQPVRVSVQSVSASEGWSYRYTMRPRLRGVYQVGPLSAIWSDPLGLAHSQQILVPAAEILVHPSTENVFDRPLTRMLEDPPIRPPKTKPWPQGFEFYGMRDYVPGDDLRRVVWKAVARTGRMLVRESEQGVTDHVNILVDTDHDWHQPGEPSDTFEMAVRVAASVGTGHIKNGFSVSLDSNEKNLRKALRGPQARLLFLDEMARLGLGKMELHHGIDRLLSRRAGGAHNVIITPHFDSRCAARAGLIISQGASVLVCILLWEETDPASVHRASEIGAEVIQVRAGSSLAGTFARTIGAGIR